MIVEFHPALHNCLSIRFIAYVILGPEGYIYFYMVLISYNFYISLLQP